ncbi:MAG: hypothetical protein ACRECH_03515 [Nitrososphaerales archaeon]
MSSRLKTRREIPVRVQYGEGPSIDIFLDLNLPNGRRVNVEDETGHVFTRYVARLDGIVSLLTSQDISLQNPDVMFQDIIHEGESETLS